MGPPVDQVVSPVGADGDGNAPAVDLIVCGRADRRSLDETLASAAAIDGPIGIVRLVGGGDGEAPSEPAPVSRVETVLAPPGAPLGQMRAVGLAAARGEFVAFADAGDRWRPGFLSTLVPALLAEPRLAFVFGRLDRPHLVPRLDERDGGLPPTLGDPRLDALRSIDVCAVLFRREAILKAGGFDPVLDGLADFDLCVRLALSHRYRRVPVSVAVKGRPRPVPDGRADRDRRREEWERIRMPLESGVSLLRRSCALTLRAERLRRPFDASTWRDGRREVVWRSWFELNSLGVVGRNLLLAIERQGVRPYLDPLFDPPPSDLGRFGPPPDRRGRLAFQFDFRLLPGGLPEERLLYCGLTETNRLSPRYVDAINRFVTLCYVPCRHNREVFLADGVQVPVVVLPHGIDPVAFPPLDRPRRDVYTFGAIGRLEHRKGLDILIRAFRAEFGPREPVRLVLKDATPPDGDLGDDPRIEFRQDRLDLAGMLDLYRSFDAFVMPSRGEGFGLCGLEAMATGLPLIATNWSGPADYLDPADSLPLSYRLAQAQGARYQGIRIFGEWAEPEEEHLRSLLRWLVDHPAEGAALGRAAAERVHRAWTWEVPVRRLRADLDLVAAGLSPHD